MSWTDWVPAITSSTILGVISFVLGSAYKAQVERSIQHSFDKKLEEVRGTIRRSDEQLAALRDGALSGLASRQANLDKRRLDAVERLWAEATTLGRYRSIAMLAGAMDIILEYAAGSGRDAHKTREFADVILKSVDQGEPKPMSYEADKERPFLDPVCWALFSAYRQSCTYPAMLLQMAKFGVEPDVSEASTPAVLTALKTALPEHATYIDKNGLGALFHLLQPLEDRLLAALVESLSGREASEAAVRHAAEIVGKVREADAAIRPESRMPA